MNSKTNRQIEIDRLNDEHNARKNLASSFPDFLPEPDLTLYMNSTLCEFSMRYNVDSVARIRSILKRWDSFVLPLYLIKSGGLTSFKTSWHKKQEGDFKKIAPIVVNVGKLEGVRFWFFALVNNHLLRVTLVVNPSVVQQFAFVSDEGGIKYLVAPGLNLVTSIRWAGGDDYTVYWNLNTIHSFEEMFPK